MKLKSLRQNFHSRNHHVYHCQLRVLDTDPESQAFVTSLLLHVLIDFQTLKKHSPANLENVLSESNFPATKIAVGPFWERIVSVQPDKTPTTVIVHKSSIIRFAILLSIIFNFLL